MAETPIDDQNLLYLAPAEYVDSEHPEVRAFAREVAPEGATPKEKAKALYLAVQAYDGEGRTFMRYEVMHGSFHDVPARFLRAEMARVYSAAARGELASGDLESEASARA